MRMSRTASFAAGAVVALVIGGGSAVAATGGTFLLGKSNYASTPTGLTNSGGVALSLKSKTGTAPLAVSSPTKVTNLNADQLDGISSGSFALKSGRTGVYANASFDIDETDPDTTAVVVWATCPTGTVITGGGGIDWTTDGRIVWNAPDDQQDNTWLVIVQLPKRTVTGDEATATAVCYNPRGAVKAQQAPAAVTRQDAPLSDTVRQLAGR